MSMRADGLFFGFSLSFVSPWGPFYISPVYFGLL